MEEQLIVRMAYVENDATGKLELAEELFRYFHTKWNYKTYKVLSGFVGRLIDWLRSSNVQVCIWKVGQQYHFQ